MDAIGIADCRHAGGGGTDAQRGQGGGASPADRVPTGPGRCAATAGLSDRPRRLWPAVADAEPGQDALRERRLRPQAERDRAACRGHRLHRHASRGSRRVRSRASGGCRRASRQKQRRPSPCRGGASLSRRRPGADRADRPDGARQRPDDAGDQRRLLSHARAPPVAGRDELHPRESDAGRGGLSAQPQWRAASEIARRR